MRLPRVPCLAADQRRAGFGGTVGHDRRVHLVRRFLPVGEELLGRDAERAVERGLGAGQAGGEEVADDGVIAETSADVRQQRLAVAVREVVRIALELPQVGRRLCTSASRIHIAVSGSTRPFEKYSAMPSTIHSGIISRLKRRRLLVMPRGDVELEDVHHFVADDVIVLGVVAGQRQDDAVHERIGEAARPFADHLRRGGGLLEVGGVRVEDDRLAVERVVERPREARVPALRLAADVVHHVRFPVVVVNVEVLGLAGP